MEEQKINHYRGGKIAAFLLIDLSLGMVVLVFLLTDGRVDLISVIFLLVAVVSFLWLAYKYYKPGFTEVICSKNGIVSKTHFEREELRLDDIKGIWYLKNIPTAHANGEIVSYTKGLGKESLKGSLIIIGDLTYFKDVDFSGINGINILCDSFKKGYTTVYYRESIDNVLRYYLQIIEQRK